MTGYKKGVGRTHLKDGSMGWIEWRLKVKCKVKYVWTGVLMEKVKLLRSFASKG